MIKLILSSALLLTFFAQTGDASILCYRCSSNQPGCKYGVNWFWFSGEWCPEEDDKCVKIIERKGADILITRECLSNLRGFRTDIPADKYEGCEPAAKDVRLGHYVNNSITQLDIHREYYDEVTWCFCYFHHWCNSASSVTISTLLALIIVALRSIL